MQMKCPICEQFRLTGVIPDPAEAYRLHAEQLKAQKPPFREWRDLLADAKPGNVTHHLLPGLSYRLDKADGLVIEGKWRGQPVAKMFEDIVYWPKKVEPAPELRAFIGTVTYEDAINRIDGYEPPERLVAAASGDNSHQGIEQRVGEVVADIAAGRVSKPLRGQLSDALDKAASGDKVNDAIGRAMGNLTQRRTLLGQ